MKEEHEGAGMGMQCQTLTFVVACLARPKQSTLSAPSGLHQSSGSEPAVLEAI